MQLSRRALLKTIAPLSALAASIAASLKSPQAAPLDITVTRGPANRLNLVAPDSVEFNWVESGLEYIPGKGFVPYTRTVTSDLPVGPLQLQRPEWWK